MKIIAILLTFTSLANANPQRIFECQFKDNAQRFRIIENSPAKGVATIITPDHQATLAFTTTTQEFSTRYGKDIVTTRVYFHHYYQYQLAETRKLYRVSGGWDETEISGVKIAEMSPSKRFTCQ